MTVEAPNLTGRSFTLGGEKYQLAPRDSIKVSRARTLERWVAVQDTVDE